jgi:hypothetical protein
LGLETPPYSPRLLQATPHLHALDPVGLPLTICCSRVAAGAQLSARVRYRARGATVIRHHPHPQPEYVSRVSIRHDLVEAYIIGLTPPPPHPQQGKLDAASDRLARSTDGPETARGGYVPLSFSTVNRFCMALVYGRARRLTAQPGVFRPGQCPRAPSSRSSSQRARRRCERCTGYHDTFTVVTGF